MNFARVKKVIVGSGNPAKIEAVGEALSELFPKAEFSGVEVESGTGQYLQEGLVEVLMEARMMWLVITEQTI